MITKETAYFSHDSNASEDPKIIRAEKFFGDLAYVWFFKTLEILRQQRDLKLRISDADIIHSKVKCPSAEMYIGFIKKSELFDYDDFYFWSNSLIARVGNALLSSSKKSKAANIKWGNFYLQNGNNKKAMEYFSLAELSEKEKDIKALPNSESEGVLNNTSDATVYNSGIDKIPLPSVPFVLSTAAEKSWRACLFSCNSTYDEIKKSYYHIQEDEFISYKKFNEMIDSENGEIDYRYIRISNHQIMLQPYVKLIHKYQDKSLIKDALIKMVRNGIKPEYIIYNKIEQFIQYVQEDRAKSANNKSSIVSKKHTGKQLINGFYHINGDKYLTVDLDDMEQCQQLIKIYRQEEMTYEQIREKREELGDNKFRIFLGY